MNLYDPPPAMRATDASPLALFRFHFRTVELNSYFRNFITYASCRWFQQRIFVMSNKRRLVRSRDKDAELRAWLDAFLDKMVASVGEIHTVDDASRLVNEHSRKHMLGVTILFTMRRCVKEQIFDPPDIVLDYLQKGIEQIGLEDLSKMVNQDLKGLLRKFAAAAPARQVLAARIRSDLYNDVSEKGGVCPCCAVLNDPTKLIGWSEELLPFPVAPNKARQL
ncbi:MAG: hypothetical protein ACRD3W_01055 [Terriglobales bacterium]